MSYGEKWSKFQRQRGQNMLSLRKQEIAENLLPVFKEAANNNAKLLAILGDVGPETAKNWLEGRNLPALATFINMARECRELRSIAIKLMDPESEYDPDFMRVCMELARARSKRLGQ